MSGLNGDYLLKILNQAAGFSAKELSPVGSASEPATVSGFQVTDNNQRFLTDIFDRPLTEYQQTAADSSNQGGGELAQTDALGATATSNQLNLGNRLIINYKNSVVQEGSTGSFYNKINEPVRENVLNKHIPEMNPSINTIVSYFNNPTLNAPTLKLSYADFLYCKKLGAYPNNRLVVLRRFAQPASDDIVESNEMNIHQSPISVMVTWFNDFPMNIEFGEKWTKNSKGLITQILESGAELAGGAVGGDSAVTKGLSGAASNSENIGNPWLSSLWYGFLSQQARNANIAVDFEKILPNANPNLIREAKYRAPTSIESKISFELNFEYVLRSLKGIDPHIAMHNIIANIIRMGTSTSVNVYPRPDVSSDANTTDVITDLANGRILNAIEGLLTQIRTFQRQIIENNSENNTNTVDGATNSTINDTSLPNANIAEGNRNDTPKLENFFSRALSLYRFKLIAAMQADTGLPSGNWHVTVGNPFNPIVAVGDLVIANQIKLDFGKELSYNDFPTEIKATVSLESARSRGAQELERIFNAGRGRIYVYPAKVMNPDYSIGENYSNNKSNDTGAGSPTTGFDRTQASNIATNL